MKRKTLTLVLCLLATFALASVGFASWILTNPDVTVTGTTQGDFTVYDATDKSVSVAATVSPTGFIFGAPVSPKTGGSPWLTYDDMSTAVLSVTITLVVTNYESLGTDGLTVEVYDLFADSKLKTAIDNKYIKCTSGTFAQKSITVNKTATNAYSLTKTFSKAEIQAGTGTVSFALTFAWGDNLGGENPFNYYYDKAFDANVGTKLKALYTALNELEFNLLITD